MFIMFEDLMQNAKVTSGAGFEPVFTGSLGDRVKEMPRLTVELEESEIGYQIVNAIGIVGEDIHSISVSSDAVTKFRPKGVDGNPLIGLNRWLYRTPFELEHEEILRLSETTDVKLTIGADGKRLVGLNRFLGLQRKREGEVAWKYRPIKSFNYIHLYRFDPVRIYDGSKVEIEINKQENKPTTIARIAMGIAYYFPTSNRVEYGMERAFKETVSGIGGVSTRKPNFYKRVVQVEIPYLFDIFAIYGMNAGLNQILSGLPIFMEFEKEEKLPIDHFYGIFNEAPLSSVMAKTLYSTKLKITEAM